MIRLVFRVLYGRSYHGLIVVVIVCDMVGVNGVMFGDMTGIVMCDMVCDIMSNVVDVIMARMVNDLRDDMLMSVMAVIGIYDNDR